PALGVVVDLGLHVIEGCFADRQAAVGGVVSTGVLALVRRTAGDGVAVLVPGVAVPDVALRGVGAALEVEDEVDLGLTRAGGQQDVAEAYGLQVDAQVLLDAHERGGVVVVGHGDAGLAQRLPHGGIDTGTAPLAVGQPEDRRAGIAIERGLGAAGRHAR